MFNFSVKLDPQKLTDKQKKSREIQRSISLSDRLSFLTTEAAVRGFFANNNLSQSQSGVEQLPLLTWPLLDYLNAVETENARMVELGSGNSTLWFAKQFKSVLSLETHPEWHASLSKKVPENVNLKLVTMDEMLTPSIEFQKEDYLLIDFAGHRSRYIKNLIEQANQLPGQIILDNSDWYRRGSSLLREAGYMEIPFFGFKSGKTHLDCTSLFINRLSKLPLPFNTPEFTVELENAWDEI